jgi:hypothetical protein
MIRRRLGTFGFGVLTIAAAVAGAHAQGLPPGVSTPQGAVCARLETQLAALDRGIGDPAASEQILRYEEAASKQQVELDRVVSQARRTGCQGSGFFLFGFGQPPQCDQINGQIQRMRANLDRIMADLQHLRSGRGGAEGQRRALIGALAQNNCGPQYRIAAPTPQSHGIFGTLFGGVSTANPDSDQGLTQSGTFRTICVRTCDGFYFPISYATVPGKFREDEQACQRMCPAAEVVLFSYRNPGEDVTQAVSINGRPYTELPNAFKYRQAYNSACSCRREGESWADAMKPLDDRTLQRGDVIVTEEKAKTLSQPKTEIPARPDKQNSRRSGNPPDPAGPPTLRSTNVPGEASPPAPSAAAASEQPATDGPKRNVRAVGPQFIAPR